MRSEFDKPRLGAITLATAFAVLVGGASLAMGQAESVDGDGDGMVSFAELLVLMPALTEEEFQALDADADGLLSADEIGAAQEAGLIPAG
ncbi:hypothetical protein [Hasllibacter sp. MH4015]|uniref:hypothetical protein n=1 Tax=Hasllibacter sp. MH4015 TaxID=2854029 RepID=UPI001CD42CE8|nr:hypothetical protein [Hasllibacter sp. MH4015]